MEELLAFAYLLQEDLVAEEEYFNRLDELFLVSPENEDLLNLEWETDVKQAVIYIRTHVDLQALDYERFGRTLMNQLQVCYKNCRDIRQFAAHMYRLWETLPGTILDQEPFIALCYADDPLSWGDEEQTRRIYEDMLDYYKDQCT